MQKKSILGYIPMMTIVSISLWMILPRPFAIAAIACLVGLALWDEIEYRKDKETKS